MSTLHIENRTVPPFRFDIVGSFLRPQSLKKARENFLEGKITQSELTRIENKEIEQLVTKEKEIGLKIVTDGEFRRSYWHLDFFWGFKGVEHNIMEHGYFFHGEETRADSARVSGKIRFSENHPFFNHYRYLKKIAGDDVTTKQTIPSPAQFYAELTRGENETKISEYYKNPEDLLEDISKAYRKTILAFYDLGCRTIQLDDCTWGMLCDKKFWSHMAGDKYDMQNLQNLYLMVNNRAIENLPDDLTVTTHVCRGNYHSTWATSGGYDPISKTLFGEENVSAFYLEYDTDRAGDFSPLKQIPDHKLVVLGLVSSKTGKLEDKKAIMARIKEATAYVPLDHLCLSPQCGFASTEEGNILTENEQWEKLAFIKEIVQEVWGE